MTLKLTLEPTTQTGTINGTPYRRWEGVDETGLPVHAYVTLVQPQSADPAVDARYAEALQSVSDKVHAVPRAIDLRFIL